jgi:hypothetical protein
MSRIYFHSKGFDEAEVSGSERAHMDIFTSDLAISTLRPYLIDSCGNMKYPILKHLKDPNYFNSFIDNHNEFKNIFEVSFRSSVGGGMTFLYKEQEISSIALGLNTAMVLGNDAVKLMARIHAQCENHTYVKPENFEWISKIITQGLNLKIYRQNNGWEELIELLKVAKEPIITSYSVADYFPNSTIANHNIICECNENDFCECDDSWEKLTHDEQWDKSWENLEKNTGFLELKPDDWNTFFFNAELTTLDIIELIDNSVNNPPLKQEVFLPKSDKTK